VVPPAVPLPERVTTPRLVLRTWAPADTALLGRAVADSLDHLRPWMSWTADEPLTGQARLEVIRTFERDRRAGREVVYGAFRGDTVVGGTGFHRRRGPAVVEIGYWVHVHHLGQGYATEMARALTDTAFALAGVDRVEIHHDRANRRSRAVPAALGFVSAGEQPDERLAPAEEGIDCRWIMTRSAWTRARD
jgi:RimJ/RimL family protein N-acetyltransferase